MIQLKKFGYLYSLKYKVFSFGFFNIAFLLIFYFFFAFFFVLNKISYN